LGIPEILREGKDLTVVTYGSMCRVVMEVVAELTDLDISIEVIDVQSLLPFDLSKTILKSLRKTNAVLFLDEDVPGGASAFMMQQVLERDGGYQWLDVSPKTLTAKNHRPTYGSDGDYFSKPNAEEITEAVYEIMNEKDPNKYPEI
jgi:2-oxoisovalerate dehydrogenase E1 component